MNAGCIYFLSGSVRAIDVHGLPLPAVGRSYWMDDGFIVNTRHPRLRYLPVRSNSWNLVTGKQLLNDSAVLIYQLFNLTKTMYFQIKTLEHSDFLDAIKWKLTFDFANQSFIFCYFHDREWSCFFAPTSTNLSRYVPNKTTSWIWLIQARSSLQQAVVCIRYLICPRVFSRCVADRIDVLCSECVCSPRVFFSLFFFCNPSSRLIETEAACVSESASLLRFGVAWELRLRVRQKATGFLTCKRLVAVRGFLRGIRSEDDRTAAACEWRAMTSSTSVGWLVLVATAVGPMPLSFSRSAQSEWSSVA